MDNTAKNKEWNVVGEEKENKVIIVNNGPVININTDCSLYDVTNNGTVISCKMTDYNTANIINLIKMQLIPSKVIDPTGNEDMINNGLVINTPDSNPYGIYSRDIINIINNSTVTNITTNVKDDIINDFILAIITAFHDQKNSIKK